MTIVDGIYFFVGVVVAKFLISVAILSALALGFLGFICLELFRDWWNRKNRG